jgi:hypothetical protein
MASTLLSMAGLSSIFDSRGCLHPTLLYITLQLLNLPIIATQYPLPLDTKKSRRSTSIYPILVQRVKILLPILRHTHRMILEPSLREIAEEIDDMDEYTSEVPRVRLITFTRALLATAGVDLKGILKVDISYGGLAVSASARSCMRHFDSVSSRVITGAMLAVKKHQATRVARYALCISLIGRMTGMGAMGSWDDFLGAQPSEEQLKSIIEVLGSETLDPLNLSLPSLPPHSEPHLASVVNTIHSAWIKRLPYDNSNAFASQQAQGVLVTRILQSQTSPVRFPFPVDRSRAKVSEQENKRRKLDDSVGLASQLAFHPPTLHDSSTLDPSVFTEPLETLSARGPEERGAYPDSDLVDSYLPISDLPDSVLLDTPAESEIEVVSNTAGIDVEPSSDRHSAKDSPPTVKTQHVPETPSTDEEHPDAYSTPSACVSITKHSTVALSARSLVNKSTSQNFLKTDES